MLHFKSQNPDIKLQKKSSRCKPHVTNEVIEIHEVDDVDAKIEVEEEIEIDEKSEVT